MQVLAEANQGAQPPEFLSTHPDPGNRTEQINALVKQLYPQGVPESLSRGAALRELRQQWHLPQGLPRRRVDQTNHR